MARMSGPRLSASRCSDVSLHVSRLYFHLRSLRFYDEARHHDGHPIRRSGDKVRMSRSCRTPTALLDDNGIIKIGELLVAT